MSDEITLRGITWNHPRGLDPLLAASDVYPDIVPGVRIEWTTRSLSGFGEDPLIDLAASYDLLIIDHPFVGDAAASTAFYPLDDLARPEVLLEREQASVGPSHASYLYAGHQWALAIDAAAQVSAVHERFGTTRCRGHGTRCSSSPLGFARDGLWMSIPMWPADLCVATYTIGKGMGLDLFVDGRVFPPGKGEQVLAVLKRLVRPVASGRAGLEPADCPGSHAGWSRAVLPDPVRLFELLSPVGTGRSRLFRRHPDSIGNACWEHARWRGDRDLNGMRAPVGGDGLRDMGHKRRGSDGCVLPVGRPAGSARELAR